MLQTSPVPSNSEAPNTITKEFVIDPLVIELKPDEGRKTLMSLQEARVCLILSYCIYLLKNSGLYAH